MWQEDFSRDWVLDKLGTTAPERHIEFEALRGDGFDVLYEASVRAPAGIRIELGRVPRRRLEVFWGGARWGRRGGADGGGAGG